MDNTERLIPKYAALYSRLSRDDGLEGESNSISNQKAWLEKIAVDYGYSNFEHYIDDGYSGTNFQRPGIKRLFQDIEDGKISAVFIKDLSRLGRNYIEVGRLIEDYFPDNDVRLISYVENLDSLNGIGEFVAYINVSNEQLPAGVSRRMRMTNHLKGEKGIPLGLPPYGYKKGPDNPRFWVIDEVPAKIVREIFAMYLDGVGTHQIANELNERGVLTPAAYAKSVKNGKSSKHPPDKPYLWGHSTVVSILKKQEYCGDVISFKTYSKSYKKKKRYKNAPEDIKVFENVHEAIVSREVFEAVQEKRGKKRNRKKSDGSKNIFAGLLVCSDCGGNLNYHFNQKNPKIEYFNCANYNSKKACKSTHHIRLDVLTQAVKEDLQRLMQSVAADENRFIEYARECAGNNSKSELNLLKKEIAEKNKRKAELEILYSKLYEDNVMGKLSDEWFYKLSDKYEQERKDIIDSLNRLYDKYAKLEEQETNIQDFVKTVHKYLYVTNLTAIMLNELIEKIVVHQAEKIDGVPVQQIDIYYRFIGKMDI